VKRFAAVAVTALALAAAGCGGGDGGGTQTRRSTQGPPPVRPAFDEVQDLDTGRTYTTKAFRPAVRFRVPMGDWATEIGDTPGHVSIARTDPPGDVDQAILALHRITRVYDPRRGGVTPGDAVPFTGDFAQWLATHPRLRASKPRPAELMGQRGVEIVVTGRRSPPKVPGDCGKVGRNCVPLFYDGLDYVSYSPVLKGRFTVLGLPGGGQLVVEEFVDPASRYRDGLKQLRPLRDSLALAR
jgi:hypothetical protein